MDHGFGVIIDTLEGTEGENFGGWLVKFLGNVMSVVRDVAAKVGQGAGQGWEEVEQDSSSGSSRKNVKVRRYKCMGKGCGVVRNSWSACDAHINKIHLKQVYGPCHDQNCPYTNYNRDTFIAHVKKCENVDKQKHKVQ